MRFQALLFLFGICTMKISSVQTGSQPEKFDQLRYERSRRRPKGKTYNPENDCEKPLDFVALVNAYGYPAEEHTLKTNDGYLLRVHRIPASASKNEKKKNRPVVFLQHGILESSDSWVFMGPSHGLAYMLADAGFDVWLGNARGNTYSRKHVRLCPNNDKDFWRYSFHEVAIYDTTSAIDYILQVTNQKDIVYLGHSMGATIIFILLSEKPEYNNKIKLIINMAPAVLWKGKHPAVLNFILKNRSIIKRFYEGRNLYEILPMTDQSHKILTAMCKYGSFTQPLCIVLLHSLIGYDLKQVNKHTFSHIFRYHPTGTSLQTLYHFEQLMNSGFKKYDHGNEKNLQVYKQADPPRYNLSNTIPPVALFYAENDGLVPKAGVIELSKELRNVISIEKVEEERFNHLDFLFARDLRTLVNDRVLKIAMKFMND